MELDLELYVPTCPQCGCAFDNNSREQESCNECECCFCSHRCRATFHDEKKLEHDYTAVLD